MKYHAKLTFTEPILGSAPADPEVYATYIAAKKAELANEEVALLPEDIDQKGLTVFRRGNNGEVILLDYQVKGFIKEAARAVTGTKKPVAEIEPEDTTKEVVTKTKTKAKKASTTDVIGIPAIYSKISTLVFVFPRMIPLLKDGQLIKTKPGDMFRLSRPLRAMTQQGPRVSLAASEMVPAGVTADIVIHVLPLGEKEISEKVVLSWLDYGFYGGISQWHSGSYGRFSYVITKTEK